MLKLHVLLAAAIFAGVPALAIADGAGSALGVKQQAAAQLSGETRTLRVGSDIFLGDRVETGPQGQVQILFGDKTELVLGPSAALTIEDYLIRNDGTAGKLAVDILSGAFRFATGDSAKNRYTIGTPTGTIGVRGTEFDGWIGKDGIPYVIRHGGTVILCNASNKCDVLDDICEVGKIAAQVEILGDARQSTGDIRATYKRWFRWTENQSSLLRQFWFPNARDCLNADPRDPNLPEGSDDINTSPGGQDSSSEPPDDSSSEPPPDTSSEPPPPPPPSSSEPPPPPPSSSEPPPDNGCVGRNCGVIP
jgi:hypothetical protein